MAMPLIFYLYGTNVTITEFAAIMTKRVSLEYNSTQIKDAFKVLQALDDSAKGKVHIDTIVKFITEYGSEKLSGERARELVVQMEMDHEGFINYEEYIDMMMHW